MEFSPSLLFHIRLPSHFLSLAVHSQALQTHLTFHVLHVAINVVSLVREAAPVGPDSLLSHLISKAANSWMSNWVPGNAEKLSL